MTISKCQTISEVLSHELSRRKLRNKSYSLRAFARDLEMSVSHLSEVINGGEGLSEAAVDGVAQRITRKTHERKYLKDLVLAEFSRSLKVRELAQKRVEEMRKFERAQRVRDDQFRVVSDWYHGAILELIQLESFRDDPAWIAKQVGISRTLVSGALLRLESVGLIKRGVSGQWVTDPEIVLALSDVPSTAVRKFHRQVLALHADSLHGDSMDDREFISTFLALPKNRLREFQDRLHKFVNEFCQEISDLDQVKDGLFSLSVQLCPVRDRRPERE